MEIVIEERQPIMFHSAASALGWADSIIGVGRCDSQMYRIMRDSVQHGIRSSNGLTLEDLRCTAHDISNALRSVRPYHEACTFRHIYGLPSAFESLQAISWIAQKIEPGAAGTRRSRLCSLALAALNSEKQQVVRNRPFSMSKFARSVGVTKQAFHDSLRWMELRAESVGLVRELLDSAEAKFSEKLSGKGIL